MPHFRARVFVQYALLAVIIFAMQAPVMAAADIDQLYREGVKARLDGRAAEATVIFGRALELQPDNTDLLLQQGLALSASDRDEAAVPILERVLQLAPDYADASEALDRIKARRLQEQETTEIGPRFRLDVGASHSNLSGNRPSWKESSYRLAYKLAPETTISAGIDISRRYNNTDTYAELRVDKGLSGRLAAYLYAGGAVNADFLPKTAVGLGGEYRLNGLKGMHSTYALLDLRYARYTTGDTWTAKVGVRQYLSQDRVWVTVSSINTRDENRRYLSGFSVRMDWQVKPDLRLLAGFANAPETSEGLTLRTRSFFGGVVYDFTPKFGINLGLAHEKRSGFYDRNNISAGLTYRF